MIVTRDLIVLFWMKVYLLYFVYSINCAFNFIATTTEKITKANVPRVITTTFLILITIGLLFEFF